MHDVILAHMTRAKNCKTDAPELSALLLKHSLLEQASKQLSFAAEPLALQPLPCPLPEHKTHIGPVPCQSLKGCLTCAD